MLCHQLSQAEIKCSETECPAKARARGTSHAPGGQGLCCVTRALWPCSCAPRVSPMLALPVDFNKPTEMYQNGICLCFVLPNGCNSNRKNAKRIFWPVIQIEKEQERREGESRVTERVKMKASREDRVEICLQVYGPHPSLFHQLYHVSLSLRPVDCFWTLPLSLESYFGISLLSWLESF